MQATNFKVLYIGVYRDGTGWGQAAIDYILALDAAGVDVVPRPLKLNNHVHKLPPRLLELEAKPSRGCDYVIQHVLPHQMDYNGRFKKNIGLFASETSDFRSSSWAERLNNMDAVWVINEDQAVSSLLSGVKAVPEVIPHATDITRFEQGYDCLDALKPYRAQGSFVFYFIGEMVRRKNLAALLKAFHLEFHPNENVELAIKTSVPGASGDVATQRVKEFCHEIKRGLKLHGKNLDFYKPEIVLTNRMSDHDIMRLHASCDCFVQPSYGEAWSIPAFDAMAMGKTPIVTNTGGFKDYLSNSSGWLVDCHQEPVFGANDTIEDLFVGSESWSTVDIGCLRRHMREAFADSRLREEKANCGMQRAYDFTHEKVGMTMKERLLSYEGPQTETTAFVEV